MTDYSNQKYENTNVDAEFVPVYYIEDDYESSDSDSQGLVTKTMDSIKSEESILDFKEITYFDHNTRDTSVFLPFNSSSISSLNNGPTFYSTTSSSLMFKPISPGFPKSSKSSKTTFRRASSIKKNN